MPLLSRLGRALALTWDDAHLAGRVRRHTEILRGLAHELSTDDRDDPPGSAAEAQQRFSDHLSELVATAPRAGLGLATGHFIDHLAATYKRYGAHLFECFDHILIPATTNALEGFFGSAKQQLRRALGSGATTHAVVGNLGAEVLLAFADCRSPNALARIRTLAPAPAEFQAARARIAREEAPTIQRRSMVRHFERHLTELRQRWFHSDGQGRDA